MVTADLGSAARKRRFLQFRLRTLIVGTGVIAIWLGWYVNSATRQREAVRPDLARGGTIEYDYQYDAVRGWRVPTGKPSRPVWLQRLLGDDYFHDVVTVGMDVDQSDHDVVPTDDDASLGCKDFAALPSAIGKNPVARRPVAGRRGYALLSGEPLQGG